MSVGTKNYVFNVTILVNWYSRPNGIVRANAELCNALSNSILSMHGFNSVYFVRYCNDLNAFVRVDRQLLYDSILRILGNCQSLENKTLYPDDRELHKPFDFLPGDVFVTMGFDWDSFDPLLLYYLSLAGVVIYTFCYDIIPIVKPEYCESHVVAKFPYYINMLAWSSKKIFTISDCTNKDLLQYLNDNTWPSPPLQKVLLGTDIAQRVPKLTALSFNIPTSDFVLYVSTFEPRKNHAILLDAYEILISKGLQPPQLCLVGGIGWGGAFQKINSRLQNNTELSKYVIIINEADDDYLSALMSASLFVVFPSLYEGWGLPVVEAMSYGKACICSYNSSLPEASQGLAEYLPSTDAQAWADRIFKLYFDKNYLNQVIKRTCKDFKSRNWSDFTNDFLRFI